MMSKKITDENGIVYVQKKPFYKKWWVWLIIALIIFYFIGISTEPDNEVAELSQTDGTEDFTETFVESEVTAEPETLIEETTEEIYAVGDTLVFTDYSTGDEFEVTLSNASVDLGGEETYEQPVGGKFIKIDVTAQNNGASTYLMNSAEYSIYDSSGSKGEVASKDFLLEEIAPGKNHSGSIYFESVGDGPYEVYLHDMVWSVNP